MKTQNDNKNVQERRGTHKKEDKNVINKKKRKQKLKIEPKKNHLNQSRENIKNLTCRSKLCVDPIGECSAPFDPYFDFDN